MKIGDDERIKEDAFIPAPTRTKGFIPKEAGLDTFRRLQDELNASIFHRPPIVHQHHKTLLNCHCLACDEYFQEGKWSVS